MEAEGEKLAAEIEALNAEIARLTDASSASGARKDTLKDVYKRQRWSRVRC